jgi:RNA polymerase sigma-70 factor (ECF subfamily)
LPGQDDILKQQLREGDIHAFKTLFESLYSHLLNYGLSLTRDIEVSKELIQEIFLKLWENREKTEIRGSLKAYLFTAMNNRALNWIRHEKIKRAYENESLKDALTGVELPSHISPFLTEAIKNAIDSLPERALQVFSLTQLENISHKEAALQMGISVKTVENQLNRARKILQKKLKKYR